MIFTEKLFSTGLITETIKQLKGNCADIKLEETTLFDESIDLVRLS